MERGTWACVSPCGSTQNGTFTGLPRLGLSGAQASAKCIRQYRLSIFDRASGVTRGVNPQRQPKIKPWRLRTKNFNTISAIIWAGVVVSGMNPRRQPEEKKTRKTRTKLLTTSTAWPGKLNRTYNLAFVCVIATVTCEWQHPPKTRVSFN